MEKIGIIGAGGWGTALSVIFSEKMRVCLWEKFPGYAGYLDRNRENRDFLPGIAIPGSVVITDDLKRVLAFSDRCIIAVPSQYFRQVVKDIKPFFSGSHAFLIATKGLEEPSGMRMSEIAMKELGEIRVAVLSGPTIAREVAEKKPTAAVIASSDRSLSGEFQKELSSEVLRLYTNDDMIGVELAGACKNVIAIGAGIIDGLGLGINTKAAYLTRGIEELKNLGIALGGKEKTFWGLAGLGDLMTTSFSAYSRNRSYGEALAKGKGKDFLLNTKMAVEGVNATKVFKACGEQKEIDLPIINAIYGIICEGKNPFDGLKMLMRRRLKNE